MKKRNNARGFTGTELMILIAMACLMIAVVAPQVMNALDRAKQKKSMKDLREWGAALSTYYTDFNFYPFNPVGPNAAIGPGIFLYDMSVQKKYIEGDTYLDGWNDYFCYSAGGSVMQTAQGYTIASLGKGNLSDPPITRFKCFQCDIRLRNGQFYARPAGGQHEYHYRIS